jgi:hypothetical protein
VIFFKEVDGMRTIFLVFLVVLASVGFVIGLTVEDIADISLDLLVTEYDEGEFIDGYAYVNISTPFDPGVVVKGDIDGSSSSRLLLDIFDEDGIDYTLDPGSFTATNPSSSKTLVFPHASGHFVFFKLPSDVIVQDVTMDIHGFDHQGAYPSFPSIDVGLDGDDEWAFSGSLVDYEDFVLPSDLDETQQGGSASLTNKEVYYCELIDLPRADDYRVSVNYKTFLKGGNISAVLLSYGGSPQSVQAHGGADRCDLPESGSSYAYADCEIHLPFFIEGSTFVCVFNEHATGGGNTKYYDVLMDHGVPSSGNEAFICGPMSGGVADCVENDKDFYIKVEPGEYSGELIQQIPFEDGFTEFDFVDALNSYLSGCGSGDCIIPLHVWSGSAGVLYFNDLYVDYSKSTGGSFSYNQFYGGSTTGGGVLTVDGVDLTVDEILVTIDLSSLNIVVPHPDDVVENMTLEVELEPGPQDDADIVVHKLLEVEEEDVGDVIDAYLLLFQGLISDYGNLLSLLGHKNDVDNVVLALNRHAVEYEALNGSGLSEQEQADTLLNISTAVDNLVIDLPRFVVIEKSVRDEIVVGVTDISDAVVLPGQEDRETKDALFLLQEQMTIDGLAEFFTVEFFDGTTEDGTLITKTVSSPYGNAYIVEVIPSFVASSVNDVNFLSSPETVKSSQPGIVRWFHASLGGVKKQYVLSGDKVVALQDMKTIVVPKIIPDLKVSPPPLVSYVCGDGVCSVLDTDAGVIPLEDSFTCPQDCARDYPVSSWIIGLLVILGIVWYFNFYHGKFSYEKLMTKITKKHVVGGKKMQGKMFTMKPVSVKGTGKVFVSAVDERKLVAYVKDALKKGFSKGKVSEALLKKGWTREQVEHVLRKVRK